MKRKLLYLLPVLSLLLASCAKEREYACVVPADASAVMVVRVNALLEKSGLANNARMREKLAELASPGIATDDPVYLFASADGSVVGAVARVANKGKLQKFLANETGMTLQTEEQCQWTQLTDNTLAAFNDAALLVLANLGGEVTTIQGTAFSLLRQQKGNGFDALPEYGELLAQTDDLDGFFDMKLLPDAVTQFYSLGASGKLTLDGVKCALKGNFETGKASLDLQIKNPNDALQQQLDAYRLCVKPLKGNLLEYFHGGNLMWGGMHVDGKALLDYLMQIPEVQRGLSSTEPFDVKQAITALNGDIAVGFSSLVDANGPHCMVYGEVTDDSFLGMVEVLRPLFNLFGGDSRLDEDNDRQFHLRMYNDDYWFGMSGNNLYYTNDRTASSNIGKKFGVSMQNKSWAASVSAQRIFVSLNAKALSDDLKNNQYRWTRAIGAQNVSLAQNLCPYFDAVNVNSSACDDWHVQFVLRDEGVNPLALALDVLQQLFM